MTEPALPPPLEYATVDPTWLVRWTFAGDALELNDAAHSFVSVLVSKPKYLLILFGAPMTVLYLSPRLNLDTFKNGMLSIFAVLSLAACMWGVGFEMYLRWRRPSRVRLEPGRLIHLCPAGSNEPPRVYDLREIVHVDSILGSSRYHAFCSVIVLFQNGAKLTFLHCRNQHEARWIAAQIRTRVDAARATVIQV
jgi:hypothetical protein